MKHDEEKAQSLLSWLQEHFPKSSKNNFKSWLLGKRIEIEGKTATSLNQKLDHSCKVKLLPKKKIISSNCEILYEDRDLIVIDKPSGLLSVAKETNNEPNLHDILKNYLKPVRPFPVHRLDKDTSGVLVFAKNEKTRLYFNCYFAERKPKRRYLALVEGKTPQRGQWLTYLVENKNLKMEITQDKNKGKLAITNFQTLSYFKEFSLLEIVLETGRKNQIRVQASYFGYPITGDFKYGATKKPLNRLALHAENLIFEHPKTGKKHFFSSRIPFLESLKFSILKGNK